MSIHVYFPAPIEYPFSDFRSVCVGGSDPHDVESVIHRRFGLSSHSDRSASVSPATFTRRRLDPVSDVGADHARDALHPLTYKYSHKPALVEFCYIFIHAIANRKIPMHFIVADRFPTMMTLLAYIRVHVLPDDVASWAHHFLPSFFSARFLIGRPSDPWPVRRDRGAHQTRHGDYESYDLH